MAETKKNTRLNNIISNLSAKEEKKVLTALKQLRNHGKKEAIFPLVELLHSTISEEVKSEATSLLFDLKDPDVVDELIKVIEDDRFINERAMLISIFWQSSLDSTEHISTIVKQAIKGDYMTGIEVLSVIDSYDATFQESEIEDLKVDLEEAIQLEETEKRNLLISIQLAVDALNLEF
jgi:23S rRNA C2498 (ribose-2'-O)-methylase RlmM